MPPSTPNYQKSVCNVYWKGYADKLRVQLTKDQPPAQGLEGEDGIHKLRERLAALKKSMTASTTSTNSDVTHQEPDKSIEMRDGTSIAIRIHSPKQPAADGCPGLVIYHGGGFCLGGLDSEVALCRKWTALGGVAVNVDYRLAPEHVFPTAVHDAYDSLIWVCGSLRPGFQDTR